MNIKVFIYQYFKIWLIALKIMKIKLNSTYNIVNRETM